MKSFRYLFLLFSLYHYKIRRYFLVFRTFVININIFCFVFIFIEKIREEGCEFVKNFISKVPQLINSGQIKHFTEELIETQIFRDCKLLKEFVFDKIKTECAFLFLLTFVRFYWTVYGYFSVILRDFS